MAKLENQIGVKSMFRYTETICPRCLFPFILEDARLLLLEGEDRPACLVHSCLRCRLVIVKSVASDVLERVSNLPRQEMKTDDSGYPLIKLSYACKRITPKVIPLLGDVRIARWLDGYHEPVYRVMCRVCDCAEEFAMTPQVERYLLDHHVSTNLIEHSHRREAEWVRQSPTGIAGIRADEKALQDASMAEFLEKLHAEIGL